MTKNKIIEVEQLKVKYGEHTVLHDVNFTIYERDFLGIVGPNGGGKTTLMKTLLGLKSASSGQIRYFKDGTQCNSISMGYLPQYNQIDKKFPISVFDVILSGMNKEKHIWNKYTAQQHQRAHDMVNRMGLNGLDNAPLGSLSGGQMQRALLGRAIVARPDVVVLDEPNTYIDKRFEAHLYKLLEEINNDCAIILVSHDIGAVLQNVRSIACVNETLDYHPDTEIPANWLEQHFGCPIDLIGHGSLPHRILKCHHHD